MSFLTFHDTPISIIEDNGQLWMPGPEIGVALGYEAPGEQIARLYARNKLEFVEEMTRTVKTTGRDGRKNTVRVFSPRGALLLAMHANTERAAAFRAFVLDILEGKRPLPGQPDPRRALAAAVLSSRPRWQAQLRYRGMGLSKTEIARLLRVSPGTVAADWSEIRRLGLQGGGTALIAGGAAHA